MTNEEYVRSTLSDRDLALLISGRLYKFTDSPFLTKCMKIHDNWAKSASTNTGNMMKGIHGETVINENPSIWRFEHWCDCDNTWKRLGRTHMTSIQVWLSKQYDPKEWNA